MTNGDFNDQSKTSRIVDSVTVKLISRAAMMLATAALPIVGWMVQRGVNAIDEVNHKVDVVSIRAIDTHSTVKLIQQVQSDEKTLLADHEARVRVLENANRARSLQPPPQ